MIIINHHAKLDETCHYAYSRDDSWGCYSLFALKKTSQNTYFSLVLLLGKVIFYQGKDSINYGIKMWSFLVKISCH